MKIEIKSRWSGSALFSLECGSMRFCLETAVKSRADLSGADLSRANLSGANLSGANLSGADLSGADLSGANLSRANLSRANLYGANLYRANLSGADLSRADLSGADLSGANLYGANLYRANLYRANLSGANLSGADLSGADLSGANLSRANLYGANLYRANLSRANLYGANGLAVELINSLLSIKDYAPDSEILAYKLVNKEGYGPFNGSIKYEVGKSYEVKDANCNSSNDCGPGINVATLPWCLKNWQKGYYILIVKHLVKDVAAIPNYSDGKYRLHRCTVIGIKELDYKKIFNYKD